MLPEKHTKLVHKCTRTLHHAEHVITPCVLFSVASGVHILEVALSGVLGIILVILIFVDEVPEA